MTQLHQYGQDQLLETLPSLVKKIGESMSHSNSTIINAVESLDLSPAPYARKPWRELQKYPTIRFEAETELDGTFERKLRAAVTKHVGKPSGTNKAWNLGAYEISFNLRPQAVILHLVPQYSLETLRAAAAEFLAGVEIESWLAKYDFTSPSVHVSPTRTSITLSMAAAVKPPDTKPASDDENLDNTRHYLRAVLGESQDVTTWMNDGRTFEFRRMKSRSRSIRFTAN